MLNKENRLTKRKEFNFIYKNGKKIYSDNLILTYTPTKLENCRFGIVVSKKVGKAVKRNKIKRQISEIIRQNLNSYSNKYNYIFIVKPSIIEKTFNDIEMEISKLLQKILHKDKE